MGYLYGLRIDQYFLMKINQEINQKQYFNVKGNFYAKLENAHKI